MIGDLRLVALALFTLVSGGLTYGVAWLSWVCIERPFLRIKRYVTLDG